ncbi:MAG TPA: hypothetical protein PKA88_01715 [Polyangiaceae bacterium]|nr:hypothetical protein [Polyangiaceae bacterium]
MQAQFRLPLTLAVAALSAACGSQQLPVPSAPSTTGPITPAEPAPRMITPAAESTEATPAAETSAAAAVELPTQCVAPESGRCLPPAGFVQALCNRTAPEVALSMFRKGTPWARAYLRLDRQLWLSGKKLARPVLALEGEELLVLKDRTGGSGMIIGGGSYDVLRWDGTCVSVSADEVSLSAPRVPTVATINWKYLPDATQESLLANSVIQSKYRARVQKCRADAEACEQADQDLSQLIATHVRAGGPVAEPTFSGW